MTLRTGLGTTGLLAAAAAALFGLTVAAAPNALAAPKHAESTHRTHP